MQHLSQARVKTVQRKLHAFVSRLHIDTTEDELPVVSYFNDVRIPDVKCSKIKPPEGYTFIMSALKVTSDAKYAKFYDENNSPDSCNVTDWYM